MGGLAFSRHIVGSHGRPPNLFPPILKTEVAEERR